MKKLFLIILFLLILLTAGLYQFFLGHKRLYYDTSYHLYVFSHFNKYEDWTGEIRIGENLFCMDNIIICEQNYEMPLFKIIPLNDTLYLYDIDKKIKRITSNSIPIVNVKCNVTDSAVWKGKTASYEYAFEDSTAMLLNKQPISIECDLTPLKFDSDKNKIIFLHRLF